jgi:hypothetical protein
MLHDGWCCSEMEGKMPVGQPLPFGQMQIEIHIGYVSGAFESCVFASVHGARTMA